MNLKGMQRLWGRKISDLSFSEFLQILESLDLSVREWRCPSCQSVNGRDENASRNICAVGVSTVGLGDVSRATPAIAV